MKWAAAFFLLAIVSGGGYMFNKARGLRNNNPGNIRHGDNWQGMAEMQTDENFVQFASPVYGIRAMNKIFKTYQDKYHIDTVRGLIAKWAPPDENDTASYAAYVAEKIGVAPDARINLEDYAPEITTAIIKYENGLQPYDVATIQQGVTLAWV